MAAQLKFELEKTPHLIAFASVAVLISSVAYDFGFFLWFGLSFSEVPTSLTDHIRSSLVWLPTIAIILFILFSLELFNRRVEKGMSEEEIINSSSNPKFTAWFRNSPIYGILAFSIFILITPFINIKLPIQIWMLPTIISWFLLHNFFFHHENIINQTTKFFYLSTRWLPAILIFIVFYGANAAESSVKEKSFIFNINNKNHEFKLIRSFDKFFMVWDVKTQSVEFINPSSVNSFRQKEQNPNKGA